MAKHYREADRVVSKVILPRGMVIAVLAALSWGLVVAAWVAGSATFSFLLGAS